MVVLATIVTGQDDTIRISTRLVQLNVVVRDKSGAVAGLKHADFTVLDNKKPQKIALFSVSESRSVRDGQWPRPSIPHREQQPAYGDTDSGDASGIFEGQEREDVNDSLERAGR